MIVIVNSFMTISKAVIKVACQTLNYHLIKVIGEKSNDSIKKDLAVQVQHPIMQFLDVKHSSWKHSESIDAVRQAEREWIRRKKICA